MGDLKTNIKVKTQTGYDHILPTTDLSLVGVEPLANKSAYDSLSTAEKTDGTIRYYLSDDGKTYVGMLNDKVIGVIAEATLSKTSTNPVQSKAVADSLLTFSNKSVATTAWTSDTTFTDYPFKAVISCTGVTANHVPTVNFDLEDALSGVFAPVSNSGTNTVTIYATETPSSDITIPSIMCIKGGV